MNSIAAHLAGRGRSLEAAAKRAGVTVDRMREVVGGAEPTLKELRGIADALRVPLSSLLEAPQRGSVTLLFRESLGQRQPARATVSIDLAVSQIEGAVALAKRAGVLQNTGWLDLFRGETVEQRDGPERLAGLFRKAYGNLDDREPFGHLPRVIAEELGVFVLFGRDSLVEGVSAIVDGYALVLLAARSFGPRVLFTLAHELGHLIAHHDRRGAGYAMIDFQGEINGLRHSGSDEERFANHFASSLLLPKRGVLEAMQAIRKEFDATGPLGDIEINALARIFNVSFEVAASRCEQLGLLMRGGARALYAKLIEAGTNPEQRAAKLGLPERAPIEIEIAPSLVRAALDAVRTGSMSLGRAAEILNVSVSTLVAANKPA